MKINLGNGSFLHSDLPPKSIIRAQKRMSDALAKGREPDPQDASRVLFWLDKQHRKYGGILNNRD